MSALRKKGAAPLAADRDGSPRLGVPRMALTVREACDALGVGWDFLDRALDDQSGAQLRQLRQRLARVLADSDGEQLVDLGLYLRRRR